MIVVAVSVKKLNKRSGCKGCGTILGLENPSRVDESLCKETFYLCRYEATECLKSSKAPQGNIPFKLLFLIEYQNYSSQRVSNIIVIKSTVMIITQSQISVKLLIDPKIVCDIRKVRKPIFFYFHD